jgi:hypothetical protein
MGTERKKDTMMQVLEKPIESKTRLPFSIQRPSYVEAKEIIRGKVFSHTQYQTFRKNNPQFNLPSMPQYSYIHKGWVNAYEFFGTTSSGKERFLKQFWADVKAGKRTHTPKYKAKAKIVIPIPDKPKSNVVNTQSTTTFQDKQTFIALAKKLGVYDQVKPAFKTLFTYDELLDLVNL